VGIYRTEVIWLDYNPKLQYLCEVGKKLYNEAMFVFKENLNNGKRLSYVELYHLMKENKWYKELPSHTAQGVLKMVIDIWKSYFRAVKEYNKNPKKFCSKPRDPKFKRDNELIVLSFSNQQCSIRDGKLKFPKKVGLCLKTRLRDVKLKEVRLVPKFGRFKVEIVYEEDVKRKEMDESRVVAIDLGVRNIVCMVNNFGEKPIVIRDGGKGIKSIKQFFNKMLAKLRSIYDRQGIKDSKRLRRLRFKCYCKEQDWLHKVSRKIVNWCIENRVGKIVIGINKDWKREINLGKKNNQVFVGIPFRDLIKKIRYKAEEVGIEVIEVDEYLTSQTCSCCGVVDKSNRKFRGLYVCKNCGKVINADVNAAYNIMKKVVDVDVNGMLRTPVVWCM